MSHGFVLLKRYFYIQICTIDQCVQILGIKPVNRAIASTEMFAISRRCDSYGSHKTARFFLK